MKRILMMAMMLLLVASVAYAQQTGSIQGNAKDDNDKALTGVKVQLRNVDTGALAGTTTSGANGAFSFTGLNPGNYIIEIVDSAGRIIGASASMSVAAGAAITGVTVAATAAGAVAAAAAAGGLGAFFTTTGGILVLAGVGAGITAGVIAATRDASPSR